MVPERGIKRKKEIDKKSTYPFLFFILISIRRGRMKEENHFPHLPNQWLLRNRLLLLKNNRGPTLQRCRAYRSYSHYGKTLFRKLHNVLPSFRYSLIDPTPNCRGRPPPFMEGGTVADCSRTPHLMRLTPS